MAEAHARFFLNVRRVPFLCWFSQVGSALYMAPLACLDSIDAIVHFALG
jgi:hypothetical protein